MPVDGIGPLLVVPVIAVAAYRSGAMSGAGALAGAAVGLAITAGAGWAGFAMLATLLFVGTAASARGRRGRGPWQAAGNGAVAAAAALAAGAGAAWGFAACAGALAAALSDTLAGELGQRLRGRARLLLVGPRVPAGADGGMSPVGTAAGVVGALLVPLAAAAVLRGAPAGWILAVAAAGFGGNLVDSLVGATLQPRLGPRGNDLTNLIATAAGALLAGLGSASQ